MNHMELFATVARDIVAAVLAFSGIAKLLTAKKGHLELMRVWHLPHFAQRGIEVGLPWIECGLAWALFVGWQLQWVGGIVVALFGAFTATVALNLVKGQRVPCNCFGAWSKEPIGMTTLFRNLLLLGLALFFTLSWYLEISLQEELPLFSVPISTHLLSLTLILVGILVGQILFFRRGLRGELQGAAEIIGGRNQ